ncbi:disease resistance protein RGA5-like isoform X2 [Triticum dicoccoides]|uniref:disease resistance protein RGA5-like isoform X2 n=1 Tax=Triticum dicoccoides TaxID=85692 RepID=UPI00188FB6B8|nr:disease resistance protein RGA5-like isoform X2 [Triticum dicoccoides]
MAGIVVSASIGVMNPLLRKLATLMGEEFAKLKNLRKEVKYISDELSSMKDALERLEDVDELDVQTARWRDAVREMSYDIEDIIDDFMCKIGEKNKKSGFVHDTIQRLRTSRARHQIAGQIEDIKKLVRETSARRERYKVDVPTSHNVAVDQRVVALYEDAAKLVGLEGPTNKVVSWLKDEKKQLKVVSIVGFGGLGKTTLANEVYHKLKAEFQCGAFVSVSQKPNVPKLLHSLLTQLGCGQSFHGCHLNVLLDQVRENLKNKRTFCSEEACLGQLRDISVEILKKCGGLPLAIISISSLLSSECSDQKERWKRVRDYLRVVSDTNLTLEAMRQILNLSYKNLPRYLKTCFLYLGMFPEDYEIRRFDLVRLWISEGFISKERGQSLEQTGISYFNELVNRSLIQPVWIERDGSVITCKVHDMLLDLILYKSAEENFITVVDNLESITRQLQKPRRMLFNLDGATLPRDVSMSQVRSFANWRGSMNIPSLAEFKYLRVFKADFSSSFADDNCKIDLTGLCKLYQLRHIQIRGCWNCQLPTQIRGLQMLETFHIDGSCVPMDIFLLPCLLSLRVSIDIRLPEGIGEMKSLQHLCPFDTMHTSLDNIKGLGKLTNLSFLVLKTGLSEEVDMDALNSSLAKLCNLELLRISSEDSWIPDALTLSPPPSNLVTLLMEKRSHVPNWIGELHNLQTLELTVEKLDKDGVGILAELPALINLELMFDRALDGTIAIDGTAFAHLKRFRICCNNMPHLTFQAGAMPKLQTLSVWLRANGWNQDENAAPTGMEHLSALERISVRIGSDTESEKRSAESAIRSAINMHPYHAHIRIKIW